MTFRNDPMKSILELWFTIISWPLRLTYKWLSSAFEPQWQREPTPEERVSGKINYVFGKIMRDLNLPVSRQETRDILEKTKGIYERLLVYDRVQLEKTKFKSLENCLLGLSEGRRKFVNASSLKERKEAAERMAKELKAIDSLIDQTS